MSKGTTYIYNCVSIHLFVFFTCDPSPLLAKHLSICTKSLPVKNVYPKLWEPNKQTNDLIKCEVIKNWLQDLTQTQRNTGQARHNLCIWCCGFVLQSTVATTGIYVNVKIHPLLGRL